MLRRILDITLACFAVVAIACSSDEGSTPASPPPPGCNEAPFDCAAGTSCWPEASGSFACLPSNATAQEGEGCRNTPGVPSCAPGLACLQLVQAGGTCVSYCDAGAHPCASGACTKGGLSGTTNTFTVCVGGGTSGSGGAAGMGGGTDASCSKLAAGAKGTYAACASCCQTLHPDGQLAGDAALDSCACTGGTCTDSCGGSVLCAGQMEAPSSFCNFCLQPALEKGEGSCSTNAPCADGECKAYTKCISSCLP